MKLDTANSGAGRTAILEKFNQLSPASEISVAHYITQLLECSKELSGTELGIPKETFISHLLPTLPKSFDSIIDIITHHPEAEQTTDCVISTMIEWEVSNRTRKTEGESTKTTSPATALTTYASTGFPGRGNVTTRNTFGRSRQPSRRSSFHTQPSTRSGGPASGPTCWYCLCSGNRQDDCDLGKRAEEAKKGRAGSRSRGNGRPEGDDGGVAFASVKALADWIIKRSSENHTGFGTWIVDSGASHHVCGDRIAFDSLKRLPKPTTVYLGDGS